MERSQTIEGAGYLVDIVSLACDIAPVDDGPLGLVNFVRHQIH